MHDKLDINNILLAVIFSAMGVTFPILFHLVGLGSVFMPMYIPLALGAYMLTLKNAAITGFFTPLASAVLTGMPPFYPPIAPLMMLQLTVFCCFISFMTHRFKIKPVISILAAIIIDRLILACYYFLIIPLFGISPEIYTAYHLIKSFPGLLLMIITVPLLVPVCVRIIKNKSLRLYEHNERHHHEHD
ncbi:MAG: hypothetical protein V1874_16620 [Spirochaetota bacterium]